MMRISIHALRGEGDAAVPHLPHHQAAISIHALRGEGDVHRAAYGHVVAISIHALRGEGDSRSWQTPMPHRNFYPRPPWEGDQQMPCRSVAFSVFLSTPSVGRATLLIVP